MYVDFVDAPNRRQGQTRGCLVSMTNLKAVSIAVVSSSPGLTSNGLPGYKQHPRMANRWIRLQSLLRSMKGSRNLYLSVSVANTGKETNGLPKSGDREVSAMFRNSDSDTAEIFRRRRSCRCPSLNSDSRHELRAVGD